MTKTPLLLRPLTMRGLTIENRIVVSPMCQYSSSEGSASDWHVVNLGHMALSGPGIAFFEATHVSPEARITARCLGLYSDANEEGMARVVQFVRTWAHTKIGVQLAHAGRKGGTPPPWGGPLPTDRWQPVGPSAIAYKADWQTPRALDDAGLQKVRDDFVAAARRCDRLGIDVIELHFAHGYLAHQFLSPLSNARTDAYGGSLENRMRFPLELFDGIRAVWPESKPLGVRISATDHVAGGWDLDGSQALAVQLKARGCDFIDVSSGGLHPDQHIEVKPGYQVQYSAAIRHASGLPTIAVGAITKPEQVEEILEAGDADMIALARGYLRDPRWTWAAADELGGEAFCPPQYQRGRSTERP
ncbi:MAG: NADH:flavin oxidoreductase/NADH oxidase [Candidatus Eremiobacteraeota bacterium]|nr:NADH:flavin oxidoreductase/NADH oxidase [Candidatus Eremiobacteraeota bacterium]